MMRITLSRPESFDPIQVIEQASAQAAAERMAFELMHRHCPNERGRALSCYYQKDSNTAGDFIDLVIEGEDHGTVSIIQRRLDARGYETEVEYLQPDDLPDLIEITDTGDGCPADEDRARQVMEFFGYTGLVEPGPEAGLYRVSLPQSVLKEDVAMLCDGDWHVEVVGRENIRHDTPSRTGGATAGSPGTGMRRALADSGWLLRGHPREGLAAEADAPTEAGLLSLVAYPDGKITYLDWTSGYSRAGHVDDPLLPHQLAESAEIAADKTAR